MEKEEAVIVVMVLTAQSQMFQGECNQAPTTNSHTKVTGMKIFQPRRMIWS
jgi:hypothetical protein